MPSPLPVRQPIIVEDRRKSTAGKPRGKVTESASKNLLDPFRFTISRMFAASMPIVQKMSHAAASMAARFCSFVAVLFSEARYLRDGEVFVTPNRPVETQ